MSVDLQETIEELIAAEKRVKELEARSAELEGVVKQFMDCCDPWPMSLAKARAHQYFEAQKHERAS